MSKNVLTYIYSLCLLALFIDDILAEFCQSHLASNTHFNFWKRFISIGESRFLQPFFDFGQVYGKGTCISFRVVKVFV
jgi:hypothetical protein